MQDYLIFRERNNKKRTEIEILSSFFVFIRNHILLIRKGGKCMSNKKMIKKDEVIMFRCTSKEKGTIVASAESADMTASEYIRTCINYYQKRRKK